MFALFSTIPLIGHLNPLILQAGELQRRGWQVAIAVVSELRDHVSRENPALPIVDLGPLGAAADTLRRAEASACRNPDFARGTLEVMRGLDAAWPLLYDGVAAAVAAGRPDVMVIDVYSSAPLSVADLNGIPIAVNVPGLIGAIPVTLLPPADDVPFMFSGRSIHDVGWGQRLAGPFVRRAAALAVRLTLERDLNRRRASRGLTPIRSEALLRGRTTLVNSVFGLEYPRPLPPWVHMVGPMLAPDPPALPADLARWLDDGPPVVYANLGTLATASDVQLAALLDGLSDERYRALWILSEAQAARLPRRAGVRILPWGPPPVSVLAHRNVRVFLSHCGMNSIHESIAAGTPVLGIPMFVDQLDWAVRVADAGAGVWLDKTRFGAEDVRAGIVTLLDGDRFSGAIAALQRAFTQAGGVGRAADLIERTARGSP